MVFLSKVYNIGIFLEEILLKVDWLNVWIFKIFYLCNILFDIFYICNVLNMVSLVIFGFKYVLFYFMEIFEI